jgi:hypothetical protein
MEYSISHIKQTLGKDYDPESDYMLETHRGAINKVLSGEWEIVGELPDATLNDKGTMVIMKRVKN